MSADEVKIATYKTEQALLEAMMVLPGSLAHQVAGGPNEHRVHAILSAAIRMTLTAFADRHAAVGDRVQ